MRASLARHQTSCLATCSVLLLGALAWYAQGLPLYWNDALLLDLLRVLVGAVPLAWVLRRQPPRQRLLIATAVALGYLLLGLGLFPVSAVALLFCAAWSYGRLLLWWLLPGSASTGFSAPCLIGLALLLAGFGITIHGPWNPRWLYLATLLAPPLFMLLGGRLPGLYRQLSQALRQSSVELLTLPWWSLVAALLLFVLVARLAFFPTLGLDDNTLHLRLWTQLLYQGHHSFDIQRQVWETAPFAVDLLHAIASYVAGEDARGALNLALLALLLRQLWHLLRTTLTLPPRDTLFITVLFISTPLLGSLLLTLQAELFLALLALTGTRLLLAASGHWCTPGGLALGAIAALCIATKLPGTVLALTLLLLALYRWRLTGCGTLSLPRLAGLFGFLALLTTLALNAYATAWWLTGNPVFPLYNGIFQSPYFAPVNFSDPRWQHGFSPLSWWQLFFRTSAYLEAADFTAGFQYCLLLPLALLLLPGRLRPGLAPNIVLPLLAFGLALFAASQYWRYLFPVLPLASLVLATPLLPGNGARQRSPTIAALSLCLILNLLCYPGVSSLLQLPPPHGAAQRAAYIDNLAPARALTAAVNQLAPGSQVLYPPDQPYGATLLGEALYPNWYAPAIERAAQALRNIDDLDTLLQRLGVDYVIAPVGGATAHPAAELLRAYLARQALPLRGQGELALYRLTKTDTPAWRAAAQAGPMPLTTSNPTPLPFASDGASAARYRLRINCPTNTTALQLQLNWDRGPSYRRLVSCDADGIDFAEAFPIPSAATRGTITFMPHDAGAELERLTLELYP